MHKQNETFNKEIETFQTKTKTKKQKEILELKNIRPDLKTSTESCKGRQKNHWKTGHLKSSSQRSKREKKNKKELKKKKQKKHRIYGTESKETRSSLWKFKKEKRKGCKEYLKQ